MRKVLLAFDGIHFSEGAFNFAKQLNEKNPILLTGIFLPQVSYANLWTYADGVGTPMFVPTIDEKESELIEKNIEKFEALCVRNAIEFRVRKDFDDLALPELKKESRFSDLLIVGEEKFYEDMGSGNPNNYLKETLHNLECSAIVVPEKFEFPTLNILTYDGSESSVFAIKQFVYLLPEFLNNPTFLTYANMDGSGKIPNEAYIEELASRHFQDLTISKVNIDSKSHFATWVADKNASIIVAGSFGRTTVSQLFSKSFVFDVIRDHKIPVFICHR